MGEFKVSQIRPTRDMPIMSYQLGATITQSMQFSGHDNTSTSKVKYVRLYSKHHKDVKIRLVVETHFCTRVWPLKHRK